MIARLHNGDKINHWTLIEQVPKPEHLKTPLIYWLCECDCPERTHKIVSEAALIHNKTHSCGCHLLKDIRGKHIGKLEVLYRDVELSKKKGETYWYCKCDCGNYTSIANSRLISAKPTLSCGCLRLEKINEKCKKYNTFDLTGEYGIGYTSKHEAYLFDLEDYDLIKNICWYINKGGYLVSHSLRFNRMVMNCNDDNLVVDHINHNPLDNRKSNLRICHQIYNIQNSSMRNDNTSGVTGIYKTKNQTNPWVAEIVANNYKIRLGKSNSFNEMVRRRIIAEWLYHDHFSPHYNIEAKTYSVTYKNPDNGKHYKATLQEPQPLFNSKINIEEITYEELLAIDSERGTGALGSSNK